MTSRFLVHCQPSLAALLLVAGLATSGAAQVAVAAPRIVFAETSHDFGEIEEGELLTRVFRFRNDGDRVLEAKGG